MTTCMICTNEALQELMNDGARLRQGARDLIQGIRTTANPFAVGRPARLGTCIVERCARLIEVPCSGCREAGCQRCSIAAELRAAEDRIHAERDAELMTLETADQIITTLLDRIVEGLCQAHAPFGTALLEEWYRQKGFATIRTDLIS